MATRVRAVRKPSGPIATADAQIRAHALAKPEATEHFPWGDRAIKVKGKVFLFMGTQAGQLSLSAKLPETAEVALLLPFATPTGYGLGKAGWVSAQFDGADQPPVEMLCAWIDESYQAVAPAKLAALARAEPGAPAAEPVAKPKRAAVKQPPAKRSPTKQSPTKQSPAKPAKTKAANKPAKR
jgi:predicted DNA-binding protein (MmcQ/YjbR family)